MKSMKALLIAAVGLGVWFAGCEVNDPGSPVGNTPPTTILSVAPRDSAVVNHYITLRWAGNDADGTVTGFNLYVDGVMIAATSARDTTIAFEAPSDGTPILHSFAVQAVDNEGLVDPTPASRVFYTVNFRPVASFDATGSIREGASVTAGFRVTIAATDSNPSLLYYSVSLDDTLSWIDWVRDTAVFVYADPQIIADAETFPDGAKGLPNGSLTAGAHTLYARVKDAGDAISPTVQLNFTVIEGCRPTMNPTFAATYGGDDFYADGSIYYSPASGLETQLAYSASDALCGGEINAYRYRQSGEDWSTWSSSGSASLVSLPPGDYTFEFMARNLAGAVSDTISYTIHIVQQVLADSLIVIDETASGNGRPGSPNDEQVDQFYADVITYAKQRTIDYEDSIRFATYGANFVSPYDVHKAGLIVWHGDDRSNIQFNNNLRLLTEFLDKGGRLIVSGWDVLGGFPSVADSAQYAAGSFAREKLRAIRAWRNPQARRNTTGFEGVGEFPTCRIDSTKLPSAWRGALYNCWVFQPRGECIIIGTMTTNDANEPLTGRPCAYIYDLSFRVAVFGVPLYFCYNDDARALMDVLIPRMMQGLSP